MRKIDALLMSVLILYDFGAQSIVETKNTSFGQTFEIEKHAVRGKHAAINPLDEVTANYNISRIAKEEFVSFEASKKTVVKEQAAIPSAVTTASASEIAVPESAVMNSVMIDESPKSTMSQAIELASEDKISVSSANIEENANAKLTASNDMFRDGDGDGVFDKEDKCPNQSGVARFDGCPVPDSDGDGVNDEEDRCPLESGTVASFGCPVKDLAVAEQSQTATEISSNEQNSNTSFYNQTLLFSFNSSVLTNDDFNVVLQIADRLINDTRLKVDIYGYSDKLGSEIANKRISLSRAMNVAEYLTGLGVHQEQINIKGLGSSEPLSGNNSGEGQSDNRRVEMHLKY